MKVSSEKKKTKEITKISLETEKQENTIMRKLACVMEIWLTRKDDDILSSPKRRETERVCRWILIYIIYMYIYIHYTYIHIYNIYYMYNDILCFFFSWWRLLLNDLLITTTIMVTSICENVDGICIKCILSVKKKNQFTLTIYSNE